MKTLNAAAAKYNSISLIIRILCGLIIGAVLALTVPGAGWVAELGTLFVGALKGIAPVLVFVIVASALAQGSSKLDRRFATVIWLYMLTTFLAAATLHPSPAFCSRSLSSWRTRQNRTSFPRVWARC